MPGAGKSTVGEALSKRLGWTLVDTDHLIEKAEKTSLQTVVDSQGYLYLRQAEEKVLLGLDEVSSIIATGGSAVYSKKAMAHLQSDSIITYLHIDYETMLGRIGCAVQRGLAKPAEQSLEAMYQERLGLYQRYAELSLPSDKLSTVALCDQLIASMPHNSR